MDMETCPLCGHILEIIECCGGGIWRCDNCGEFFYYGELIEQTPPEENEGASPSEPSSDPHEG